MKTQESSARLWAWGDEEVDVPQRGDVQPHRKGPVGISEADGAGRAFLKDGAEGRPVGFQKSRPEATVQPKHQKQASRQMWLESQRHREFTTCSAGI